MRMAFLINRNNRSTSVKQKMFYFLKKNRLIIINSALEILNKGILGIFFYQKKD